MTLSEALMKWIKNRLVTGPDACQWCEGRGKVVIYAPGSPEVEPSLVDCHKCFGTGQHKECRCHQYKLVGMPQEMFEEVVARCCALGRCDREPQLSGVAIHKASAEDSCDCSIFVASLKGEAIASLTHDAWCRSLKHLPHTVVEVPK